MPRVVSGIAKGLRLNSPRGMRTRPTSDRVKESVFNIIRSGIGGSHFLDLFAGTGQMGIEALSQGAARAVFIDASGVSQACIKENLKKARLTESGVVIKGDYAAVLKRERFVRPFDHVYIDPPYADSVEVMRRAVSILTEKELLSDTAMVILEHDASVKPDDFVINLQLKRSCKYGGSMISFYEGHLSSDPDETTSEVR